MFDSVTISQRLHAAAHAGVACISATVLVVALLLVALGLAGCANQGDGPELAHEGKLTLAVSTSYEPFAYTTDRGDAIGFDIAVARELAERMDVELSVVGKSSGDVAEVTAEGDEADIGMGGLPDTVNTGVVDFTDYYYVADYAVVVGGAIKTDSDLKKATIAVREGSGAGAWVTKTFPRATVLSYDNEQACYSALESGEVQAAVIDLPIANKTIGDHDGVHVLEEVVSAQRYAIAVSKDNPLLRDTINAHLSDMKADGTIDRLQTEYLS